MESQEEVLRARNAELEKENKHLWETLLDGGEGLEPRDRAITLTAASPEQGGTVNVEAATFPRPVACPGCGGQNTADGVCLHCGAAHEMWQ